MDFSTRANEYNKYRKADPSLVGVIFELLNLPKGSIVADVGAGTGNYSKALSSFGYKIVAVEPEEKMRNQANFSNIIWVNSFAENINLPDSSVDAVIAINSVHHFSDFKKSQQEFYRILKSGPSIIVTFDPIVATNMWIFDYWKKLKIVEKKNYPSIEDIKIQIANVFGSLPKEITFDIPRDFEDVFSAALWSKPHVLFEKNATKAMSLFSSLNDEEFQAGLALLKYDLEDGTFQKKYANLNKCSAYDVGCRILLARKD